MFRLYLVTTHCIYIYTAGTFLCV